VPLPLVGSAQRPSLEYQHAFDLIAVALHGLEGPIGILASHRFYARGLAARLDTVEGGLLQLTDQGEPTGEPLVWAGLEDMGQARHLEQLPTSSLAAVVWAEPERDSGPGVLPRIGMAMAPAGVLYVVSSTWLRRFLPEWRAAAQRPAQQPAGHRATLRWLDRSGWQVVQRYGFHGPRSMLWGLAAGLAVAVGRRDGFDRCHAAMRMRYVVCDGQAMLAPVSVLAARKR
jgi:hypothetical protein